METNTAEKVAATTKKSASVTRVTLADQVAHMTGLSSREAVKLVDSVLDTIRDTLAKGDEVMISGFGKFVVLSKRERMGRNPQTGEAVKINARRVLKFRPSDVLKSYMNQEPK
jgi:integration host factor subunit alpha